MRIKLGCINDTSYVAMRFRLDFPNMEDRIKMAPACAHLKISAKKNHQMPGPLNIRIGNRFKRSKSWIGCSEETVRLVCEPSRTDAGEEWTCVLTSSM